jgi:hypothetical protein
MLGKLLKSDFRSIGRSMFPVYLITIALSVILSVMVRMRVDSSNIFTAGLVLFVSLRVGSTIGTVILLNQRFSRGLLGNEGYLYFALPVRTSQHIASKLLNAIIWGFMQVAVVGVSGALMLIVAGELKLDELIEAVTRIFPEIDTETWLKMGKALLLMLLEIVALVCFVYLCDSIGHLFSRHRSLWTVVFGIAILVVRGKLTPHYLDFSGGAGEILWYILPVVFSAIYLGVTWFILDRRLNLE